MRELVGVTIPPRGHGSDGPARLRWVAAIGLAFYATLPLAALLVGVRQQAPEAPSWSLFHFAVVSALALGIISGRRWAWRAALVLAAGALLLLPPLMFALVSASARAALVPRLDLVLASLEATALVFLLVLLARMRRAG